MRVRFVLARRPELRNEILGERYVVNELPAGELVVERAFGRVAAARRGGANHLEIVDIDGRTLIDGVVPPVPNHVLAWPEYWWSPTPAPPVYCHATTAGAPDETRCGWVDAAGAWIAGDDWATPTPFIDELAGGRRPDGTWRWVDVRGETFAGRAGFAPPSGGLAIIAQEGVSQTTFEIADRAGRSVPVRETNVAAEVDGRGCTDPSSACNYRFHEARAAVWASDGASGWSSGYLGPDGAFAIRPLPCTAKILSGPFHDGRAFQCSGDEYVMIDAAGTKIAGPYPSWGADPSDPSPNTYTSGLFFAEGLAAVPVSGGWGYVDVEGRLILPGPYEVARPFRLGMAAVLRDGVVSYIDRSGATVLDPPAP